jgi:hypothetical protein
VPKEVILRAHLRVELALVNAGCAHRVSHGPSLSGRADRNGCGCS